MCMLTHVGKVKRRKKRNAIYRQTGVLSFHSTDAEMFYQGVGTGLVRKINHIKLFKPIEDSKRDDKK